MPDKQKISKDNCLAEMYTASDQVLNLAIAGTYYQIVGLTTGNLLNATVSSSRVTVQKAGYYKVEFNSSFTHATNNTIIHLSLFVDGVENTKLEIERKIGTGGDIGAVSSGAIILLTAGQILDIRARTVTNTGNLTTSHFNFNTNLIEPN